ADQFDDSDETEKKQKSSFFNWFYFSINIGALVAYSVLVWIQTNIGWGWGFGIPAVAMAIAVVSFFSGCAEVFTFIGQLEFFYGQAPDAMRSLCSALSLTTAALGNYLSTFLVNIVADFSTRDGDYGWIPDNLNYGQLHYFFWLLAVLSVLNLGAYLMVARWYTFKTAPI
ncbi:hypothetical protein Goshw_010653, partial [Gossypium schwendimanii]|nr:hypothetical protein [Gossypium schwendimanii]